jgi:Na+/phosphate symporter
MQLSAKERLLEGVNKKIEEYLQFMQDTQINQKNHAEIALQIKNSNELLKLRDTIEKQVLEQKSSRDVGGGSKKLFEDEST